MPLYAKFHNIFAAIHAGQLLATAYKRLRGDDKLVVKRINTYARAFPWPWQLSRLAKTAVGGQF
jgi:hypothetical protein